MCLEEIVQWIGVAIALIISAVWLIGRLRQSSQHDKCGPENKAKECGECPLAQECRKRK